MPCAPLTLSLALRPTARLELCDAVVKNVSHAASNTGKVVVTQIAKLMAVHVEVLERNAGGINLVDVHDLLQPLPHLVLAPELRLGVVRPQATCVTRHHQRTWTGKTKESYFCCNLKLHLLSKTSTDELSMIILKSSLQKELLRHFSAGNPCFVFQSSGLTGEKSIIAKRFSLSVLALWSWIV